MDLIQRLSGAIVGTVFAIALAAPDASAGDNLLWNRPSDGSWCGSTVSIGNQGTQVFTQVGSYGAHAWLLSAHDANPPTPIWDDYSPGASAQVSQDSATEVGVHAVVHQTSQGMEMVASLRKFSDTSSTADWAWPLPFPFLGGFAGTAVTDDGERIVVVAYDYMTTKNRVAVFGPDSNVPLAYEELPMFMPVRDFVLSGDGSTLCVVSDSSLEIYDLDSLAVLHSHYLFSTPNLNALSISADGSVLAFGTTGAVEVYERSGNQYTKTFGYTRPSGSFSDAVAVSSDGSTLACGFWLNDGSTGLHVAAIDVASQVVLTSQNFSAAGGNCFRDVSITADGSRFAVGFSGGDGNQGEEVQVFQTAQDSVIGSFDVSGMVNDLEISPDGTVVAVAHSGSNDDMYAGGGIRLFEVCDRGLALRGVPTTGSTVTFRQRLQRTGRARVLCSAELNGTPTYFNDVGWLYLERSQMVLLPPSTPTGDPGVFDTEFTISRAPGTTLYFQGVGLGPRELSENYVKMTVLP